MDFTKGLTKMVAPGSERRTEIQWLRALAAIEIALVHSDLITKHFSNLRILESEFYYPIAGIGVEVFFIVSGYIMAMKTEEQPTAGGFMLSRIRRLYPMYWIFTSIVILAYLLNPAWNLHDFKPDAGLILSSYLILPQMNFPVLGVGWTLEFEMVFYSLVGLVILVTGLRGRARPSVGWILLGLGAIGCIVGSAPAGPAWFMHLFSPYMFAFGLGWLFRYCEKQQAASRATILSVFVGVALLCTTFTDEKSAWLVMRILMAAAVFGIVISFRSAFEADTTLNKWAWTLGDASYTIYLSHWFVLSATGKVLGTLGLPAYADIPVRIVGIAAAVAAGVVIFYILEKPLDRWLRRLNFKRHFPSGSVSRKGF